MSKKKVLVFGGGGAFGLIPLIFLKSVSERAITHKVDFLAGTSIGGFIALSIASGKDPRDLFIEFKKEIKSIFYRPLTRVLNPLITKYDVNNLNNFLKGHFKNKTMRDLSVYVIIPSISFRYTAPVIFNNFVESQYLDTPLWEVARATMSAPTYFPPFGEDVLIDGGIIENIPIITSTTEIREHLGINFSEMDVLAIGSGDRIIPGRKTKHQVGHYTIFNWLTRFLIPYITKSNEMSTILWSRNMGFGNCRIYNPIETEGELDDYDQVLSGNLEKKCFDHIPEFSFIFNSFINS